jgi:tetratricopeptide (TPR) repeat protein
MNSILAVAVPPTWSAIAEPIAAAEAVVRSNTTTWRLALVLTLLVIVAGSVSSLIQVLRDDRYKLIVALCGAAAAMITTINGLVFPYSAKELYDRVSKADSELRMAGWYMVTNDLPPTGPDRLTHLQAVRAHLARIEVLLHGGALPGDDHAAAEVFGLSKAFAQQAGPRWFDRFPRQEGYLYFIGTGVGDSLSSARAASLQLAHQEAQRAILDQFPPSADASGTVEGLVTQGGIVDTHFSTTEEKGRTIFEYSVLYALKKKDIEFYLSASGVEREEALSRIQRQTEYFKDRWNAYADALDLARKHLVGAQYDSLVAARNARRDKNYVRCVELLEPIVKPNDPAWYLGWYNLGLAYWNLHRYPEAEGAFSAAIALEPKLQVRDPSVYNTFGQFLLERDQVPQGKEMLKKALAMNPDITGAKYALRAANRSMATPMVMSGEAIK